MSVYERLSALSIPFPEVAAPVAAYAPFVQTGNLLFLSVHIARKDGKPWVGELGLNMTTEQGNETARAAAIDLIATLNASVRELT